MNRQNSRKKMLSQQIKNNDETVAEIQNTLNLGSNQLDEIKQSNLKAKADDLKSVIDLGTRSQTQMESAYTNLTQKMQALDKKQASLQQALNRSTNDLVQMGPVPARDSEISYSQASSKINAQIRALNTLASSVPATCSGTEKAYIDKRVKDLKRAGGK